MPSFYQKFRRRAVRHFSERTIGCVSALIPLFPLPLVLFPDTPLPLHIFEPRYREMIAECLAQKKPFGIVRALKEGVARVGCTALIEEVVKRYDDGRLDILTLGQRRFELGTLSQERSFVQAEVEFFDDSGGDASPDQRAQAVKLQQELIALSGEKHPGELPREHPQLSFQLAAAVPLDLDFKQAMLGLRSEHERLDALIRYYENLLPSLKRALKARTRAGGNGHVN
jgi:Lon protease-like protein